MRTSGREPGVLPPSQAVGSGALTLELDLQFLSPTSGVTLGK